jgi:hypothetical protein
MAEHATTRLNDPRRPVLESTGDARSIGRIINDLGLVAALRPPAARVKPVKRSQPVRARRDRPRAALHRQSA